jgi:predicted GNAT family N-acyltransferase
MNIEITSFSESENEIRSLRDEVFGIEQGVPRELDWDDEDSNCAHVLAKGSDGSLIGTGRMRSDGKIGRLAVVACRRGNGIGGDILEALVGEARARGLNRVYLHAQFQAVSFYEKHGFRKQGLEFVEAGIPHVKMIRNLQPASGADG